MAGKCMIRVRVTVKGDQGVGGFPDILFHIGGVIGDGAVDTGAAAHQETHLAARLKPPKQIGHQADKPGFGNFMGVRIHGIIDAPDFHDGDDRAPWRSVRVRPGMLPSRRPPREP